MVCEHILFAERMLDRSLEKGEIVDHINGIRNGNRPEKSAETRKSIKAL
jgi:hypothetical protein